MGGSTFFGAPSSFYSREEAATVETLTDLELTTDPADWSQHNLLGGQSWSQVGGSLRWTTDGSNATDTTSGGVGAMLVWPTRIFPSYDLTRRIFLQVNSVFDVATAADIGVGQGYVIADAAAPAQYAYRMEFFNGVNQTVRDGGEIADITRNSSYTYRGGEIFRLDGNTNNTSYNPATGANSLNNQTGGAFALFPAGGVDIYYALFFKGGASAGSVDLTGILGNAIDLPRFTG